MIRMKRRIKVSYIESWDLNGTHYTQLIRIPHQLKDLLNEELEKAKKERKHPIFFNSHDFMNLATEFYSSGYTLLTLTSTRLVKHVLDREGQDTKRIKLDRNTRIQFY